MATVAVVGSGFSGTLTAIHLLRASTAEVMLIERGPCFARGVAYSTTQPEHRLNVRAANMSAFPDRPGHFAAWLDGQAAVDQGPYVSRGRYGDYLTTLLAAAEEAHPGRLRRCVGNVTEIVGQEGGFRLVFASGPALVASAVVLALGNLPPHDPPGFSRANWPADLYVADPWGQDFADGLDRGDEVAAIGTGLTMVDVVIQLRAAGFTGRVTALSRRGLVPRPHGASPSAAPVDAARSLPTGSLSRLLGATRARADRAGWRQAVDELRPVTRDLWRDASASERARFLRHLRPWWDVHRHRLAPSVAATVAAALGEGALVVEAGRLLPPQRTADGLELDWRRRADGTIRRRRFRRVINCTGPASDLSRTAEPVLSRLAAAGTVRPDVLHLGLDVTAKGEAIAADGQANPRLFVVGPMSRGAFWEIVAVPDIRVQVQAVADHVAAALASA